MEYLGPEFLTWMWYRGDVEPRFVHEDGTEVFVHFDEHLEFRGERSAARRTTLRAGMPGASREARAALRTGKLLTAARLLIARGEEEVRVTLRGEDLSLSSLRLPSPDGETVEDRAQFFMDAQERFLADLDLCFNTFLNVRCSDAWQVERDALVAWSLTPSGDERGLGT